MRIQQQKAVDSLEFVVGRYPFTTPLIPLPSPPFSSSCC